MLPNFTVKVMLIQPHLQIHLPCYTPGHCSRDLAISTFKTLPQLPRFMSKATFLQEVLLWPLLDECPPPALSYSKLFASLCAPSFITHSIPLSIAWQVTCLSALQKASTGKAQAESESALNPSLSPRPCMFQTLNKRHVAMKWNMKSIYSK